MNETALQLQYKGLKNLYYPGLFIVIFLLRPVFLRLSANLSGTFGFDTKPITYLYYGILWIILVFSLNQIRNKITMRYFIFVFISIAILLLQCVLYKQNNIFVFGDFFKNIPTFSSTALLNSFLFIFIGGMVKDYEKLRKYLYNASRIGMVFVLIADVLSLFVLLSKKSDDMAYSYGVCILTCDVIFECFEKRNKIDIVLIAIGIISIFISGTRGPLLCIVAIFLLWTFLYQKKAYSRIMTVVFGGVGVMLVGTGWIYNFLFWVDKMFQRVGITNLRILQYIYSENLTDLSGRDDIYSITWNKILERPFTGYGIGGDRAMYSNAYTHNIVLEILCHFGILFGLAICAVIFYYLISSIFCKNRDLAAVCTILFASIVIKLLLSSSYILSQELFLMLGLILNSQVSRQSTETSDLPVDSGGKAE